MNGNSFIEKLEYIKNKRHLFIGGAILIAMLSFLLFTDYGLLTRLDLELKKIETVERVESKASEAEELKKMKEKLRNDELEIERIVDRRMAENIPIFENIMDSILNRKLKYLNLDPSSIQFAIGSPRTPLLQSKSIIENFILQ